MTPAVFMSLPELVALANKVGLREVPYATVAQFAAAGRIPGIEKIKSRYFIRQDAVDAALDALLSRPSRRGAVS